MSFLAPARYYGRTNCPQVFRSAAISCRVAAFSSVLSADGSSFVYLTGPAVLFDVPFCNAITD